MRIRPRRKQYPGTLPKYKRVDVIGVSPWPGAGSTIFSYFSIDNKDVLHLDIYPSDRIFFYLKFGRRKNENKTQFVYHVPESIS